MKGLSIILAFLLIAEISASQSREFQIYPNGLIYNESTMKQLSFIVDSLNLKFKTCDLDRIYYSNYQGYAHLITMEKGNIKQARRDIEGNISFEDFIKKYPGSKVERDLLVVSNTYTDYEDKETLGLFSVPEELGFSIDNPETFTYPPAGTWLISYYKKSKYTDEKLKAYYFVTSLERKVLPHHYARMIQYSNCLVDTSTRIFKDQAERSGGWHTNEKSAKMKAFMNYIHKETNKPPFDENNYEEYYKKYDHWYRTRIAVIDTHLISQDVFQILLKEAIEEAMKDGGSSDEFEEYVGRYYSRSVELELKRGRIVVGGCSMDDSPRVHAMNIAVLSAETVNWEVFLRAHLDIMNDHFERVTDGSYAWHGRKTYIRELEELDINVTDLALGISLRIENPAKNHYYGSIRRIGRALAESENPNEVDLKILNMIKDTDLDPYNRVLMCYLFLHCNYHVSDTDRKSKNFVLIREAVKSLPENLREKIAIEEFTDEK